MGLTSFVLARSRVGTSSGALGTLRLVPTWGHFPGGLMDPDGREGQSWVPCGPEEGETQSLSVVTMEVIVRQAVVA